MKCLILNADYTPLAICSWRQAFIAIYLEKMEIIEVYSKVIQDSVGREHNLPAVIKVPKYIKRKKSVPFSKRNIYLRDRYTCQYCGGMAGHDFPFKHLTYDHVIPRSKWNKTLDGPTPTVWENVVSACIKCNTKKGNCSLHDIDMELLSQPHHPNRENVPIMADIRKVDSIPQEWVVYIQAIYKNRLT